MERLKQTGFDRKTTKMRLLGATAMLWEETTKAAVRITEGAFKKFRTMITRGR